MSTKIKVKINSYGIFHRYFDNGCVDLILDNECTVQELKNILYNHICKQHKGFNDKQLVEISAFATENKILQDEQLIRYDCSLSILPPVCGG